MPGGSELHLAASRLLSSRSASAPKNDEKTMRLVTYRDQDRRIKPGETIVPEVEGLGQLVNPVVAEA
jgi:hypothetical protein